MLFKFICLIALLSWLALAKPAAVLSAQPDGDSDFNETPHVVNKIAAVGSVSWWSHDATGYHPCILLKLENYSGKDLTGQKIRFQARFVDLSDGIVTIARREVRQSFAPHQQIYALLKAPQPFELPIDDARWPVIECKVMARVGEVGDEGTQTLIVTKLESITMNDDDAMQKMSRLSDFRSAGWDQKPASANHQRAAQTPLKARTGKLATQNKQAEHAADTGLVAAVRKSPGLGDDFYAFEKTYGLPHETNTNDPGWAWARYKHAQPEFTLIAGSKGKSGKADVLILELPQPEPGWESEMTAIVRCLSGSFKSEKPGATAHSVKYLPSGRMQFLTCAASKYQAMYFSATGKADDGNTSFLVLSRQPSDLIDFLSEHAKRAGIIQPISRLLDSAQ